MNQLPLLKHLNKKKLRLSLKHLNRRRQRLQKPPPPKRKMMFQLPPQHPQPKPKLNLHKCPLLMLLLRRMSQLLISEYERD